MITYSEYNKKLTEIFNKLFLANQFFYQLFIILILIIIHYQINGNNQKKIHSVNQANANYLLASLALIFIISIMIDIKVWNNLDRTIIFGLIILCVSLYIYQQYIGFKRYIEAFIEASKVEPEDNTKEFVNKTIKDEHIHDYIPDEIKNNIDLAIEPEPYIKGGEFNKIKDSTLQYLPVVEIPNPKWDALDKTVQASLMEHRENNNKEIMELNTNGLELKSEIPLDDPRYKKVKWDLNRYYPGCSKKELDKQGGIPDKTIQYCTNLPEPDEENFVLVSGNKLEQIKGRSKYINAFQTQFDIGGTGVITN